MLEASWLKWFRRVTHYVFWSFRIQLLKRKLKKMAPDTEEYRCLLRNLLEMGRKLR